MGDDKKVEASSLKFGTVCRSTELVRKMQRTTMTSVWPRVLVCILIWLSVTLSTKRERNISIISFECYYKRDGGIFARDLRWFSSVLLWNGPLPGFLCFPKKPSFSSLLFQVDLGGGGLSPDSWPAAATVFRSAQSVAVISAWKRGKRERSGEPRPATRSQESTAAKLW